MEDAFWQLCIIVQFVALMSNLTGIVMDHQHSLSGSASILDDDVSLANTRVLTIGVAGLVGGPFVGLFVGVISGIFRVYMGGADAPSLSYLIYIYRYNCWLFWLTSSKTQALPEYCEKCHK